MSLDFVQNLKAQLQAVAELWRFMLSLELGFFAHLTVGVFSEGYCLIHRYG